MMALEVIYPSTNRPSPLKELLSVGASVPIGTRGKVYVDGYNDMAIKQKMGIQWIVKDPDGWAVEDYLEGGKIDWTFEYVNPDAVHHFYGDRFDINKVGTYTIAINLLMNRDSPVIVDSYNGALCTVVVEVPPVPPDEEAPEEINWLPVILIGGGVVLAAVALMPKKK